MDTNEIYEKVTLKKFKKYLLSELPLHEKDIYTFVSLISEFGDIPSRAKLSNANVAINIGNEFKRLLSDNGLLKIVAGL